MVKNLLVTTLFVAALLVVCSCSSTGEASRSSELTGENNGPNNNDQGGYLATSSDGVTFVQWSESGNSIEGFLQNLYVATDAEGIPQVQSEELGFSGTLDGGEVSMTFSELGTSRTWTGTLEGDTLTLTIPDGDGTLSTLRAQAATVEDYNEEAQEFRQRVAQQAAELAEQRRQSEQRTERIVAQQEAVRKADEELGKALDALDEDIGSLQSAIGNINERLEMYAGDINSMREDYERLQQTVSSNPGDCFTIENTYSADFNFEIIQGNLDYFTEIETIVESNVARTTESISQVQDKLGVLQRAVEANESGTPVPQYGSSRVDESVSSAREQISATQEAVKAGRTEVESFRQEAKQIRSAARQLVGSSGCEVPS